MVADEKNTEQRKWRKHEISKLHRHRISSGFLLITRTGFYHSR